MVDEKLLTNLKTDFKQFQKFAKNSDTKNALRLSDKILKTIKILKTDKEVMNKPKQKKEIIKAEEVLTLYESNLKAMIKLKEKWNKSKE